MRKLIRNRSTKALRDWWDAVASSAAAAPTLTYEEKYKPKKSEDIKMDLLSEAVIFMIHSHDGQTDLSGHPYFLHPLRVMFSLGHNAPDHIKIAALLHDTIEDCHDVSEEKIKNKFGPEVSRLVSILTRPCEQHDYYEYIKNIKNTSHDAVLIKRADLQDNYSRPIPKEHEGLKDRYWNALELLDDINYG